MNSIQGIWKARVEEHIKETRAYLKYMLNDHLVIVMIFFIAGAASWYSKWLKTIPDGFPAYWVMAVLFSFILTSSYVRTLIKEADLVFLLPLEANMKPYFNQAFRFSFIIQLFPLLAIMLILAPLYFAVSGMTLSTYLFILLQMLVLKVWNMSMQWRMTFFGEKNIRMTDQIVRFFLNICAVYFALKASYMFAIAIYMIMVVLLVYFTSLARKKSFKWEQHIDDEIKRKQRFYRLANLFTDVPHLRKRAKRRAYLDWLLNFIPYDQRQTFTFMYSRAFIRSNDYLGIVLRLTVIFAIIIGYFSSYQWVSAGLIIFTVFITGIQLTPLFNHFSHLSLQELYPVNQKEREKSFFGLLHVVLSVQAFILATTLGIKLNWTGMFIGLMGSLLLIFVIMKPYFNSRLKKNARR
ncbi:ABC transporter permease [Bacillus sp. CLL-7-23]|uniref:ABC transporter permease n=1 Tax=Bacillus changyiensis TaxID=3004103 RepID=A0ABT4X123_9BACI|nr:ABC transporter permease [Bacillus changyiensis]MDA7025995.1 ABC transporter permease [Bacillus changyiensis]